MLLLYINCIIHFIRSSRQFLLSQYSPGKPKGHPYYRQLISQKLTTCLHNRPVPQCSEIWESFSIEMTAILWKDDFLINREVFTFIQKNFLILTSKKRKKISLSELNHLFPSNILLLLGNLMWISLSSQSRKLYFIWLNVHSSLPHIHFLSQQMKAFSCIKFCYWKIRLQMLPPS